MKTRLAWSLGYELNRIRKGSSPRALTVQLIARSAASLILDVGANEGQFVHGVMPFARRSRFLSFEPLAKAHARLLDLSRGEPRWIIAPRCAIGDTPGTATINVSGFSQSSSLLPMLAAHSDEVRESVYVGREEVEVRRLDEVVPDYMTDDDRLYLKADTQGFEKQVLDGAAGIMSRVVAVELELSYVELYAGSILAPEMIRIVTDLGFRPFGFSNEMRSKKTGELLSGDGYFIRPLA
jgi:FkbM family methyltransferase